MTQSLTARKVDTGRAGTRRFVVELLVDGKVVDSAGGNRAARANYVLWREAIRDSGRYFYLSGLRAAGSATNDGHVLKITEFAEGKASIPGRFVTPKCPDCKHAASRHYEGNVYVEVSEGAPGAMSRWDRYNNRKFMAPLFERDGFTRLMMPYCQTCSRDHHVCTMTRSAIQASAK